MSDFPPSGTSRALELYERPYDSHPENDLDFYRRDPLDEWEPRRPVSEGERRKAA